ncbi:ankyrin repeat domain-containing protein 61 [Elgaria multicarinata webbii]|uniref:ankyrin repeat domain-containing protein 61 n=1 Tax=Elgaria multicarinata webbii TaxID=159646 RepID=UPI002FCD153C
MTNDTATLQDLLHSTCPPVISKKKRNYTVFHHLLYHHPNRHRTAGCCLNVHQRTKGGHAKKRLRTELKENLNVNFYEFRCRDHHPLHLAVQTGCHHIIPDLVKRGAKVNDRAKTGQTALHLASEILNQQAIKLLLQCGANVNLATAGAKETALHLAVWSSSCKAGIILAAGGKCVELLLLNGANVHMKNWEGQEAIHSACRNGREDIINLLLNYGADANSLTQQEESPLFLFLQKSINLRKAEVMKKLLSLSYPLKLTDYKGHLPEALYLPHCKRLKDKLIQVSFEVLSLQDICKFNIRKIYGGNTKCRLKGIIPTRLWNSIYIHQEFSYAAKVSL